MRVVVDVYKPRLRAQIRLTKGYWSSSILAYVFRSLAVVEEAGTVLCLLAGHKARAISVLLADFASPTHHAVAAPRQVGKVEDAAGFGVAPPPHPVAGQVVMDTTSKVALKVWRQAEYCCLGQGSLGEQLRSAFQLPCATTHTH